jgi:cysteine desulfurase
MIYLDHNATTPIHPKVFDAMVPYLKEHFGNASSYYRMAREARAAIENARGKVAECIGAKPDEIVFTSGGTESDNLALRGAAHALRKKGNHIITSSIEHHAVLNTCKDLEKEGFNITFVPVDSNGLIDPEDIRKRITSKTILMSVMIANNETGVIQSLSDIGAIAREKGIIFHTDAVQAVGKIPVQAETISADLLSFSGHKLYGPKGVGALYIRKDTPITPILTGGHHEYNLRAGTENTAAIVGFAEAVFLAVNSLEEMSTHMAALRDRLEKRIMETIDGVKINGVNTPRVPNTSNISFSSIDGESILLHLDLNDICASSGSACTTSSPEPSHVLSAMGLTLMDAQSTVRFSLGKENTEDEIDRTVEALIEITKKLRKISSTYRSFST